MPITRHEKVASLNLDLKNYRTVHQPDEEHAINSLISIDPGRFWALMESLLDDGFSPTENIIVLDYAHQLIVKEGNRRIASLKLILGINKGIDVTDNIQEKIKLLTKSWIKDNSSVPCAIYPSSESALVEKLISRTHAKGEKAGRANWTAVARARYGRDQNKQSEPGLDLLEKYLISGKNLSSQQAERWAGDYPLTVLDEAIQKIAPHLNFKTANEMVVTYPSKNKKVLDQILFDIGVSHLGFKELRSTSGFWGETYGVDLKLSQGDAQHAPGNATQTASLAAKVNSPPTKSATGSGNISKKASLASYASTDPKSVRRMLRNFIVRGMGETKL